MRLGTTNWLIVHPAPSSDARALHEEEHCEGLYRNNSSEKRRLPPVHELRGIASRRVPGEQRLKPRTRLLLRSCEHLLRFKAPKIYGADCNVTFVFPNSETLPGCSPRASSLLEIGNGLADGGVSVVLRVRMHAPLLQFVLLP